MLYQPIILGMGNKMSNTVTQKDVDLAEQAFNEAAEKARTQYWIRLIVGLSLLVGFFYILNS